MTNGSHETRQFLGEYAAAVAEYRASGTADARRSLTLVETTPAFLAEELARDEGLVAEQYVQRPDADCGAGSDGTRMTYDRDKAVGAWLLIAAGVIEAAILVAVLAL